MRTTIFQNKTCVVCDEIALERKYGKTEGNILPYYVYEIGTGNLLAQFASNVTAIDYAKFINIGEEDEDMDASYFNNSADKDYHFMSQGSEFLDK